jgi:hypothetical protein
MIRRYIQYTKEHKEKIKKFHKEFSKPQYLGEDEMIAVRALSKEWALKKFRREEMEVANKTKEEVEEIKLEDISDGWLHLVDDNNKNHDNMTADGNDCFVYLFIRYEHKQFSKKFRRRNSRLSLPYLRPSKN